jgi:hypothetical protein
MILFLGQPNHYVKLPMHKKGNLVGRVFNYLDSEFDSLISAFEMDIADQNGWVTAQTVATFYDTCHAFIHNIIG